MPCRIGGVVKARSARRRRNTSDEIIAGLEHWSLTAGYNEIGVELRIGCITLFAELVGARQQTYC
jgi:hypothetical protein